MSFLAARLAPAGTFWVALAGGIALARSGARSGAAAGYGAAVAAMVETVAVMGPARLSGPLTQALNAPLIGSMWARGRGFGALLLACAAIRAVHYAVLQLLVVWLVVGGYDAFVDSYDRIAELAFDVLPRGEVAAVGLTVLANLVGVVAFSLVQVVVCRRALVQADAGNVPAGAAPPAATAPPTAGTPSAGAAPPAATAPPTAGTPSAAPVPRGGWALAAAVAVLWAVLLAAPSWPVLAVAGSLTAVAVAAAARAGRWRVLRLGLALGVLLGLGALGPAVLGAATFDAAGRRAVRAFLLVASAAAAQALLGPAGVRALAGAVLRGGRRFAVARHAADLAPGLRADRRLVPGGRDLLARVGEAAPNPRRLTDAVIAWVGDEVHRSATRAAPPPR